MEQALLGWVRDTVAGLGTQKEAAVKTGIPYSTLQRLLAGGSSLTLDRLSKIAEAAGPEAVFYLKMMLSAEDIALLRDQRADSPAPDRDNDEMFFVPALTAKAAAGDGSLMWGPELARAPFGFSRDWLHPRFGSGATLRMVQVAGDSQYPDLADGDWVVIDTDKTKFENGLSVIRLDDCLMIKRLQREGNFLQLISRNPIYGPITIDLSKDGDRVQVIGKSVLTFKAV